MHGVPKMVPCTTVPFLSSTVTVSLDNFIKNLQTRGTQNEDSGTCARQVKRMVGEASNSTTRAEFVPNKLHMIGASLASRLVGARGWDWKQLRNQLTRRNEKKPGGLHQLEAKRSRITASATTNSSQHFA